MIKLQTEYLGSLRCQTVHSPSKSTLQTDAPVDNNGKGETFSPTDLVASALASCMATIMGIVAKRKNIPLEGLTIATEKHMATEGTRRIAKITLCIYMPIEEKHPEAKMLQSAALSCPVAHSLHPDIDIPIEWQWKDLND